jgi:enoyl-CoA hydratase/carnithine racemase
MQVLTIRRQGTAEIWSISRPERGNGIGTTLAAELTAGLAELRARPEPPRALVLTAVPVVKGALRTWVAGGDLTELAALRSAEEGKAYAASLSRFLSGLDALPFPVAVAIDGAAIGGGAELALAGDFRVATRASSLEFKQLKAGLATGYGSARRMVELIGLGRAQGLLYRCQTIGAEEALAVGLIHQVVDDDGALKRAVDAVCSEWERLAPEALAAQKRMLWHAVRSHPGAAREAELDAFTGVWGKPGHRAFLERWERRGE